MIFEKYPLRNVSLAVTAMEDKAVIMRCPVTFTVFWAIPMDNTETLLEHGDAKVIFGISPAEDVRRSKINDRKIRNNELKDAEDRSLLMSWNKA